MNKLRVCTISAVALIASFLVSRHAWADPNFGVSYERQPLFTAADFIAGASTSRNIVVTNNSVSGLMVGLHTVGVSDPQNIGDTINITIKNGDQQLYASSLKNFFSVTALPLPPLNGYATQHYTVVLNSNVPANADVQSLHFDIEALEVVPGGTSSSGRLSNPSNLSGPYPTPAGQVLGEQNPPEMGGATQELSRTGIPPFLVFAPFVLLPFVLLRRGKTA